MPKIFPKVMVPRRYILWSKKMNLPRTAMHLKSAETQKVTAFMTEQEAVAGTGQYGWSEEKSIKALCLDDPQTEKILHENGISLEKEDRLVGVERQKSLLAAEMDWRKNRFDEVKRIGGAEYDAFVAEFCTNGEVEDLYSVDRNKLYLGVEGHHRGIQNFFDAHVFCLTSEPKKNFSLEIPVQPAVFADSMELMKFQAMGNAADGAQNRLTTLDIVNLAIKQFKRMKSGSEFRYLMGEATTQRSTGQDSDKAKKKDAGGTAVLAWNIAELNDRFPRLNVLHCLTVDKDDPDHVKLSDLSVNPNPDPSKCVPSVLQMTDMEKLLDYWKRHGDKAPEEVRKVYNNGNPILWTEEDVARWWEGRKSGAGKHVVSSAPVSAKVETDVVKRWANSGTASGYAKQTAAGLLDMSSDEFRLMEDKEFTEQANCFFDIQTKTPYGEQFADLARRISAAHTAKIDCTAALKDAVELVKHLSKGEEKPAETKQSAPSKSKSAK